MRPARRRFAAASKLHGRRGAAGLGIATPPWIKSRAPQTAECRDRDGDAGFSVIDAIPLNYSLQIAIGAGVGVLLQILGVVISRRAGVPLSAVGLLLVTVGTLFWLWGCAAYAKNKGYPELVEAVGLIGCFGLIVLLVLPNRSRG